MRDCAGCGDRRPRLSQEGESNNSAYQALPEPCSRSAAATSPNNYEVADTPFSQGFGPGSEDCREPLAPHRELPAPGTCGVLLWTGDRSPVRGCTTTEGVQVSDTQIPHKLLNLGRLERRPDSASGRCGCSACCFGLRYLLPAGVLRSRVTNTGPWVSARRVCSSGS